MALINKNSMEYFHCSACNYKFKAEIGRLVKCSNCRQSENVKSMRLIRALIPSTQAPNNSVKPVNPS
jgi:formate dehydrogenase maturation protein FdhE